MRADLGRTASPELFVAPLEHAEPVTQVTVQAAPPFEALDVRTRPFVVPEGAVLSFAVAVQGPEGRRTGRGPTARIAVHDGANAVEIFAADLTSDGGWREERVPLGRFAGRAISLEFTSRSDDPSALALYAVFGEPVVRARSIGVYGAARDTTPTIDALASEGALFENAFSSAAFTLPGHMSMMSGLSVRRHGAVTLVTPLDPSHRTLAELLQSAGYATEAAVTGTWLVNWLGFRRGIDAWAEYKAPFAPPPIGRPCEAFTEGLDWLRAHRDQPTLLFVHNYQVHRPSSARRSTSASSAHLPPKDRSPAIGSHTSTSRRCATRTIKCAPSWTGSTRSVCGNARCSSSRRITAKRSASTATSSTRATSTTRWRTCR